MKGIEYFPEEPTPLIDDALRTYHELDMDALPSDLQRDSRFYYYLSVYPGLRYMKELSSKDEQPELPETVSSTYIHVPYCTGVCNFCSYFLTTVDQEDDSPIAKYLGVVEEEVTQRSKETDVELSYLYFGGGTPSLMPPGTLARFLGSLEAKDMLAKERYGTVELHPEFFTDLKRAQEFINVLQENGVGRVSVGFQSSDESILNKTNRRHDTNFLKEGIAFLKQNKMLVNLDLMYGLEGLTLFQWEKTLQSAVDCDPDSITPYFLFVNEGTIMRRKVDGNHIRLPKHEVIQTQHIMAQHFLEGRGYFELPSDFFGKTTGTEVEYTQDALPSDGSSLPLGAGAYGYYDDTQFFKVFSIPHYRKAVEAGEQPIWRGYKFEGNEGMHRDVMFSFKNSPYLDRNLFVAKYGLDPVEYFEQQFTRLSSLGLISINDAKGRVKLTRKGRLCVEEICWQFVLPDLKDQATRQTPPSLRRKLKRHHFAPLYEKVEKNS